jgi:hypothetical protein
MSIVIPNVKLSIPASIPVRLFSRRGTALIDNHFLKNIPLQDDSLTGTHPRCQVKREARIKSLSDKPESAGVIRSLDFPIPKPGITIEKDSYLYMFMIQYLSEDCRKYRLNLGRKGDIERHILSFEEISRHGDGIKECIADDTNPQRFKPPLCGTSRYSGRNSNPAGRIPQPDAGRDFPR